jgi:hypothetical protein
MNRRDLQEYRRKLREINTEYKDKLRALKLIYGVSGIETNKPNNSPKPKKTESRSSDDALLQELLNGITVEVAPTAEEKKEESATPSINGMARIVLDSIQGEFTVLDLRSAIKKQFDKDVPLSNLSHFLKRQAVPEGRAELIERGSGKRPSRYRK